MFLLKIGNKPTRTYLNHTKWGVRDASLSNFGQCVDEHGSQFSRFVVHQINVWPPRQELLRYYSAINKENDSKENVGTIVTNITYRVRQRGRNGRLEVNGDSSRL